MKYFKRMKGEDEWKEVNYDTALWTLLTTYKDNDMTRAMLTVGNLIPCAWSEIRVYNDDGLTAMAGLSNLLPEDFREEATHTDGDGTK